MGLKNEEGRKINQKSKKGKTEEAEPKGKFLGKWITCAKIFSCGLGRRRISSAVPCWGGPPLPESAPLPGTPPLAAQSKQVALRDRPPGGPDEAALLLHKSTSKISTKEKALKRARQQKAKL